MRGKPVLDGDLRQQIEGMCGHRYDDIQQVVSDLRSMDSRYRRHKLQPFTRKVQLIIDDIRLNNPAKRVQGPGQRIISQVHSSSSSDESSESDSDCQVVHGPVRKRAKKLSSSSDSDITKSQLRESYKQKASEVGLVERVKSLEDKIKRLEAQKIVSTTSSELGNPAKKMDLEADVNSDKKAKKRDLGGESGERMKSLEEKIKRSEEKRNIPTSSSELGKPAKKMEVEVDVNSDKNPKRNDLFGESEKGLIHKKPMFKDLGGMSTVIKSLKWNVVFHIVNPHFENMIGNTPITGILLTGPPGCGKTTLAHAIANEAGVPFYDVEACTLVSGVSGESEENIREVFAKAKRTAPSIVFIDEIDAIGSKRDNQQRGMEIRVVTQLLTCMDKLNTGEQFAVLADNGSDMAAKSDRVLVIGATNRPDALDPALRRPGRFDEEINLPVPDEKARLEILSVLITNPKRGCKEGDFDLPKIARSTPGFAGVDLEKLVNEAGKLALHRIQNKLKNEYPEDWYRRHVPIEETGKSTITMVDLEEAIKLVQPSCRREGFSFIPSVKWEDIGGLAGLRKEFESCIIGPIKNPELYETMDLAYGFLLYGPPGCGKTLIAKAVANEAGANFIHIKVDCVTARSETEGGGVVDRLKKQLMIELSGSDERRYIFLIGATNRPEVIDPALLRNGRFGKLVHVTLPNADERGLILKSLGKNKGIDPSLDLVALGRDEACEDFSGADLSALIQDAEIIATEEKKLRVESGGVASSVMIKTEHFKQALEIRFPSVSEKDKRKYYDFEKSLKGSTERNRKRKASVLLGSC